MLLPGKPVTTRPLIWRLIERNHEQYAKFFVELNLWLFPLTFNLRTAVNSAQTQGEAKYAPFHTYTSYYYTAMMMNIFPPEDYDVHLIDDH